MKYNGFYFWMFKSPMKKVLAEKYGREYAADIMKKSKKVYRELVEKADDIGDDNPMAYNELFALAFVAPYVASEKKIPPTVCRTTSRVPSISRISVSLSPSASFVATTVLFAVTNSSPGTIFTAA